MSTAAQPNARARERITVMTRDGELLTFWAPVFSESGWFQWWALEDGVLSVCVTDRPRRVRYVPLVSIEWWQQDFVDGDEGDPSKRHPTLLVQFPGAAIYAVPSSVVDWDAFWSFAREVSE